MESLSDHPLAHIGQLGCPYHGLVEDGTLTLPNDAQMDYPQPGQFVWYSPGSTYLINVPGAPGAQRTPEEQQVDAAHGWQWRDSVILSGSARQLCGVSLQGGWIYCAPDGSRWWVQVGDLINQHDVTNPLNVNFTLRRFGELGADEESYPVHATISQWGQEGDPVTGDPFQRLSVESISPSGDRAVVLIWRPLPNAMASDSWAALGALELSISGGPGTFAIEFSVLRTRAQAMPSEQLDLRDPTLTFYSILSEPEQVEENQCPNPENVRFLRVYDSGISYNVVQDNSSLLGVRTGEPPDTATADRLVTLWYDENGGLHELAVRVLYEAEYDYPFPDFTSAGEHVVPCSGPDEAEWTESYARVSTLMERLTYRWLLDGAVVGQPMVFEYEQVDTSSISIAYSLEANVLTSTGSFSKHVQRTIRSGTVEESRVWTDSATDAQWGPTFDPPIYYVMRPGGLSGGMFNSLGLGWLFELPAWVRSFGSDGRPGGGQFTFGLSVHRYANNAYELRAATSASPVRGELFHCITPDGGDPSSIPVTPQGGMWPLMGSWDPVNGTLVRNRHTEVCFV